MYKKRIYKNFSRRQIAIMATEYASSDYDMAESYFTKEYNISSSTFYTILHNSISKCMVSNEIAEKIRDKACDNAYMVAGEKARIRSLRTYRRLFQERACFAFTKTEAIRYAKLFAKEGISFAEFCKCHAMSEKLLMDTLERAK